MTSDKAFQAITFIASQQKLIKLNFFPVLVANFVGWKVFDALLCCCDIFPIWSCLCERDNVSMPNFSIKNVCVVSETTLATFIASIPLPHLFSTCSLQTSIYCSLASPLAELILRNQSFISKLSGEKRNWIANAIKRCWLMLHHSSAACAMCDVRIEREWMACRQRCVLLIFPCH